MIYAASILDNKFVKIGFSKSEDATKRIAELQTGNPYEIKLLFTTYGTLQQEQSLHASLSVAFGRIRVPMPPNEWYPGKNPFFVEFLEYLKYGPDAGLAFSENYNPAIRQGSTKKGKEDTTPNKKWPLN
jgi:hypothetical protein